MTPAAFTQALAAVLAASLPEGFAASADGETLTIEAPDGTGVSTAVDIGPDDIGDLDVYADEAEGVLSLVQDVVCEALDTTWPAVVDGAVDLPIPGVRADDGILHLWFGDEDAPVLQLTPITIVA